MSEQEESELEVMQQAGIAMAANIADQGKRIQELEKGRLYYMRQCDAYVDKVAELEELIEEWRSLAESQKDLPDVLLKLQERTAKLLGEE
jgi:hypothetical protein